MPFQGGKMHIAYIHGNRATASSFNFIRSHVTGYPEIMLEYDSAAGFYRNHEAMMRELEGKAEVFFIAHSLGGIHALHLAHHLGERAAGGVTLATPYGGSAAANVVACFLPFSRVLKDIRPNGSPILEARELKAPPIWTNVVTLAGASPFMLEANDGVVTLESMRHRQDIRLVEIDCNHFEVVLNETALEVIRQSVSEASRMSGGWNGFRPAARRELDIAPLA
jgi:pimeloyl-ACP methyl ester carboxylesterase